MGHDDINEDVKKLLALLKKILKNHPHGSDQIAKFMDQKSFDLNLCFLTFVTMTPEDMIEFEEMYREFLDHSEESLADDEDFKFEFRLNSEDVSFLKKHGIRF